MTPTGFIPLNHPLNLKRNISETKKVFSAQ
jgi:hypothetical protein